MLAVFMCSVSLEVPAAQERVAVSQDPQDRARHHDSCLLAHVNPAVAFMTRAAPALPVARARRPLGGSAALGTTVRRTLGSARAFGTVRHV
jgi:hypothetical protein